MNLERLKTDPLPQIQFTGKGDKDIRKVNFNTSYDILVPNLLSILV